MPRDGVVLRPKPAAEADGDEPGCGPWTCPHPADTSATAEPFTEPSIERQSGGVSASREVA
ncbi:hypothetical protein Dfulv_21205 [Dactylosporangium fulvum]|uniref:Uncharacterized protein n=1 Tax=Dactylosporangium fulvum TaxID=53359 RepID=A0ABY5W961_9ACTN|nr:hypothetical protein [Dactylosporangium fulvum]UWP86618.1 hypothetical protein Dfulv_21205 [Dactylosporangium fulvum]